MTNPISSVATATAAMIRRILGFGLRTGGLVAQIAAGAQNPGAVVLFHADAQIKVYGGRRGEENDGGVGSQFRLGAADQLFADAVPRWLTRTTRYAEHTSVHKRKGRNIIPRAKSLAK